MPFNPEKYTLTPVTRLQVGDLVCHRVSLKSLNIPSMWLVLETWIDIEEQYVEMMSLDNNRIVVNPTSVLAVVEDV